MFFAAISKKENLGWYFIVLAFLSLYFSYERILNIDSSYSLFQLINTQTFWHPEFRIGVFLTQIPLLIAVYFELPFQFLIPLFSLTFIALYFIIYLLCARILKNPLAALVVLLIPVFGVRASFYHPVTETHQALMYTALLFAWINYTGIKNDYIKNTISFVLIAWCMFTHPISLFTVFFVIVYSIIVNKQFKAISNYLPLLFALIIFGLKILNTPSGYDSNQYSNLKNFGALLPRLFDLYPVLFLKTRFQFIYVFPFIFFIYNSVILLKSKQLLLFTFHLLSITGFIIISTLTFSNGDCDAMMEKSFLPAVFMILLVFTSLIYTRYDTWNTTMVMHAVILFGIVTIIKMGNEYTGRLNYLKNIMAYQQSKNQPKLLLTKANLDPRYVFNEWSIAVDLMVLSKIENEVVTAYIANDYSQFDQQINDSSLFLCVPFWPVWNIKDLNPAYFNLPLKQYYKLPQHIKL